LKPCWSLFRNELEHEIMKLCEKGGVYRTIPYGYQYSLYKTLMDHTSSRTEPIITELGKLIMNTKDEKQMGLHRAEQKRRDSAAMQTVLVLPRIESIFN
jgi:hypothetical protein